MVSYDVALGAEKAVQIIKQYICPVVNGQLKMREIDRACAAEVEAGETTLSMACHEQVQVSEWRSAGWRGSEMCWRPAGHSGVHVCARATWWDGHSAVWARWITIP